MWFIFSLITALAWGGSDLFSKMGTNPKDKYSHWRMVIMVGLVMGVHAIIYTIYKTNTEPGFVYEPINMLKYLPVSFMYILSMTIGYAGLRYMELSVSSPICNSSGAVTVLLCFFILGQTITVLQVVAVICILGGILLLSLYERHMDEKERLRRKVVIDKKYQISFIAILLPILYCIIDGLGTFGDALVLDNWLSEDQANISYEFTFLLCAIGAFIYLVFIRKQKFNIWNERVKGAGALCETAGQFFYVFAIADNAIVAAPMISSYCVFSVLLSRLFLKEKLAKKQYLIILLVMVGIALLGVADGLSGDV